MIVKTWWLVPASIIFGVLFEFLWGSSINKLELIAPAGENVTFLFIVMPLIIYLIIGVTLFFIDKNSKGRKILHSLIFVIFSFSSYFIICYKTLEISIIDYYVPEIHGWSEADQDGDGIKNIWDNCSSKYNPDQKNSNNDGYGDACQPYEI